MTYMLGEDNIHSQSTQSTVASDRPFRQTFGQSNLQTSVTSTMPLSTNHTSATINSGNGYSQMDSAASIPNETIFKAKFTLDIGTSPVAKSVYQLVALYLSPKSKIIVDTVKDKKTPTITKPAASDTHLCKMFEYCMRILGSRISASIVSDEGHISAQMQKHLTRNDHSSEKALRLSNLLAKLSEKSILRRRWATLCFLLSLSDSGDNSVDSIITGTTGIRLGLPLIENAKPAKKFSTVTPEPESNAKPYSPEQRIPRASVFNSYYIPPYVEDAQNPRISESMLIHDMLFVFQGVDGKYIKYSTEADAFIVDPNISLPRPTRDLIQKPCEAGWIYRKINHHIKASQSSSSAGLYEQSFYATIQAELMDYYKMIAIFENQLDSSVTLKESFFSDGLTLRRLYILIQKPLQKLRILSSLIEVCQDCKGGSLISTIHTYVIHGDPSVHEYVRRLLVEISRPFYIMLKRWIYEGELEDPFNDFFVSVDLAADNNNLWRSKYMLNHNLVPGFISKALAKKIFLIGKSLNFVRHSCSDQSAFILWSQQSSDLQYGDLKKLEYSIDRAYQTSSSHLLTVLFEKFKLMEHLQALKRFVLLGQGDFVQCLLDSLGSSLSKPASSLYLHNLTGTLETAIRSSNARYFDSDILRRLDVRLLEATEGDFGWDVFALDYQVDSPINTILTQQTMHTYLKLFTFLWRLKRIEHSLSSSWRQHTSEMQTLRSVQMFSKDIQQCFALQSEMIHFINQLQHYIFFEVIECSWNELVNYIKGKSGDLDLLIAAHNKYLNSIAMKGLLAALPGQTTISKKLFKIFDTVLAFGKVQESIFSLAADEQRHQNDQIHSAYQLQMETEYGLQPKSLNETCTLPSTARIDIARGKLHDTIDLFQTQVKTLLSRLSDHPDQNLKLLGTRLNFNEFYHI
ncbi:Microtubule-nucleating Tub4p (gamma-tubulin) complex component [Batrachochytrium dendrobatidis]|nr:Microtubule-nucleating Tub4p (gamma-tubulin) complex component [Batrachochytrium dendrobatidis]KAK5665739.1 Microtubule-nucleating Tub4p (gamma-tubulin) complex component [Batrachochytrium dendrobatidis]